jgi:predicted flap endonuclease-1-like 5' DNA nuclease
MSENKKTGIGGWGIGLFSFLAGLFIGLVILGWWLWPVQWTGGSYEILSADLQNDFLRAAIDSYTLKPDAALANQRYQGLGEYGPSTLGSISAEPGAQSAAEIEGFAAAVGAPDVVQNPPERPVDATTAELAVGRAIASPATAGLVVLLLLLLVALLILFILRRRGKKSQKAAETLEAAPAYISATSDEAILAPEPAEAVVEPSELAPAEQGEALPEWLQEPAPEGYESIEPEGIGEEPTQEEELLEELHYSAEEAETALSDEDIAEITSSQFSPGQEEQAVPDFMKDASTGGAAGAVLAAGAGLAAAAALTGEEEGEGELTVAESVEEIPASEDFETVGPTLVPPEIVEEPQVEEAPIAEATETQAEAHAKFGQDIQSVTGIGPTYGEKLRLAGITSPLLLLRNGASANGRQKIAEDTGISERLILKWVNFVDLYRIKGVSEGYAELLEAAGVDTVPELATRNPNNLHAKLLEVIQEKRVYRTPPELADDESWVSQAKKLPRAIHY